MAPEDLAPRKSGNQLLHSLARGLPSLVPHSPLLLPGTASHPFNSAASAHLGAAMGPSAFQYPAVAPLGAAAGRWGARAQGLECAAEGMATGLTSRKCCRRSPQGGRSGGGGWQPGGQLSCEQMTSAAAIALGRTKCLPRIKASDVGASKGQGPTDVSRVSMQEPDGVVGPLPQSFARMSHGPGAGLKQGLCLQPRPSTLQSGQSDSPSQARPSSLPLHLAKDCQFLVPR